MKCIQALYVFRLVLMSTICKEVVNAEVGGTLIVFTTDSANMSSQAELSKILLATYPVRRQGQNREDIKPDNPSRQRSTSPRSCQRVDKYIIRVLPQYGCKDPLDLELHASPNVNHVVIIG